MVFDQGRDSAQPTKQSPLLINAEQKHSFRLLGAEMVPPRTYRSQLGCLDAALADLGAPGSP